MVYFRKVTKQREDEASTDSIIRVGVCVTVQKANSVIHVIDFTCTAYIWWNLSKNRTTYSQPLLSNYLHNHSAHLNHLHVLLSNKTQFYTKFIPLLGPPILRFVVNSASIRLLFLSPTDILYFPPAMESRS